MDIFTTYLTRVVPVPIKSEKLKVKALVKDASSSPLSDDLLHLENHDYVFESKNKKHDEKEKQADDQLQGDSENNQQSVDEPLNQSSEKQVVEKSKSQEGDDDDVHHLDLFV